MIPRIALIAFLVAAACTNVTELADWGSDGGTDTDTDADTDTDLPDVIAMDCSGCSGVGTDMADLLCALDLCDPEYVLAGGAAEDYKQVTNYRTDGEDVTCALDDTREAITRFSLDGSENDLGSKLNGSYAILTTGDWDAPIHSTSCSPLVETDIDSGDYENDLNSKTSDRMYDAVEWRLSLRAPPDARSFSFDYVFFSVEYDEFIGGLSNDKFYATLEAASTNDGEATVISFTRCRDEDEYYDFVCPEADALEQSCDPGFKYCYIAINSAVSDCCWHNGCPGSEENPPTSIDGTGYGCGTLEDDGVSHGSSTGWLHTAWPIDGGEEFAITFHIHDTFDSSWDSAVILDRFQFHRSFVNGGTVVIE
jgi:hypothetical protein